MVHQSPPPPQDPDDDAGCSPVPWPADVLCPICGRVGPAFDQKVSAALDWMEVLELTMADVKKAVQELAS
jgi:hypothetical protein